ncbi:ankyrin repeat-containing domain protein [Aspergillus cavernicola]|uniref:Ankyrin repeat-containing domain protein n=1 Tax=Aspergillus cavernicola TaxID=176166 RepID=A0ABR4HWI0_9EURO
MQPGRAVCQIVGRCRRARHTECGRQLGRTPLFLAVQNEEESASQVRLEYDARCSNRDEAEAVPLVMAAAPRSGQSIMSALLCASADTETQDSWGNTALLAAIHSGSLETTERLIEHCSIVDCPDHQGRTPLARAAEYTERRIAELLMDSGAVVDFQDNNGRTPLSFALSRLDSSVIDNLLLDHGADVNLIDAHGRTPTSWSAQPCWTFGTLLREPKNLCFKVLVAHGAAPGIVDCYGWTVQDWEGESDAQIKLSFGNSSLISHNWQGLFQRPTTVFPGQ